jgi:hypothetical protein
MPRVGSDAAFFYADEQGAFPDTGLRFTEQISSGGAGVPCQLKLLAVGWPNAAQVAIDDMASAQLFEARREIANRTSSHLGWR